MFIIDDLLLLPFQFMWEIVNGIKDKVDEELYPDEEQCKEKLMKLNMLLESGQLSEEEYDAQEEKLMKRLRFLREYRKREAGR